jgi:hypothetical protein
VAHLTTYLDIESRKILRSGFNFTSNLTSAIGDLANRSFLASYVSHHKAMAYDNPRQALPGYPANKLSMIHDELSQGIQLTNHP